MNHVESEGKAVQEEGRLYKEAQGCKELSPPEEQPEVRKSRGNLVRDGEELGQSSGQDRPVEAHLQGT